MAPKRNARVTVDFTVRLAKARQEIAGSLGRALVQTRCSQPAAARSMAVGERTVRDWLHGVTPVNVERVLASPRLARAFRQDLCVHRHDSVGYVAKGRK